jgi:hypothetical protein
MATPQLFLATVIRPTLIQIGLHSKSAEELLLGTAIQESDLTHRRQIGGGPGRGLFQMEPATHDDIWKNYLKYRKKLAEKVGILIVPYKDELTALEFSDRYAAAMARVHYLRAPEALPSSGNVAAMAKYWKKYYNTPCGAGTEAQYIVKWKAYVSSLK